MSVLPVSALGAGAIAPTSPTAPTAATGQANGATGAGVGGNFANVLGDAISSIQSSQASADNLATQAATGSLTNVSDYMVAANEANLETQLTVAVRNNALQAFQQVMGMQL